MKKEYKRLAVHCKDATMHEKADTSIELVSIYFDKKDVVCIAQQSISPFNSDKHELYVNDYVNENNLSLYNVMFTQFNIQNVLLSDKELEYLCSN